MEMKATDLSARLLATENLSVIRARTRTASFDIKSRVLTLPMWKDMTPEIEDMLIGHEVGHALYTNNEYLEPLKNTPKLHSYMNVLEDVRIEKLIKRKYPGLRKRMNEGYKQLNDRDFFGTKQVQSFDDLLLIDKINLYFKAGFQCGVTFTPDEKVFVNRAERTETVDDIIALANDIYAYSKQVAEERKQNANFQELEDDDGEDENEDPIYGDFDIDNDDDFEEQDGDVEDLKPAKRNKQSAFQNDEKSEEGDDLESKTERAFQNKLEDLADDSTEYKYWKFDTDYFRDPVIGYKQVLNETKAPEQWDDDNPELTDYRTRYMSEEDKANFKTAELADFIKFKTESIRTVNYLVKEFEMKKSAQMHKRATVSKIGSLDMKKVYAYKLQDDLFKRVTSLPQGKNHGMVLLVDYSGSMNDVLKDTMKQVINLAMFCNRVQIPYRVYAFTTDYDDKLAKSQEEREAYHAWRSARREENDLIDCADRFHLLELFSNKMTTSEFNSMSRRILDYRFQWNDGYNTGGTPLNEALVYCYNTLGAFIKNNNVEKTTFITLTDGEGGQLNSYSRGRLEDTRTEVVNNIYKRIKIKNFIKDEVTKKTYEISRRAGEQTEMILRMMKDRYNIAMVGFHICANRGRDLRGVLNSNLPNYNGDVYSLVETWKKEFRVNGFASIKNTGRDELFLIPQSSTKIQEGEFDVNANANAKAIAKNFGKYLNVKKTSRVLLNRFVALVA
jgi:Mg-chelatase subunit ChlD